MVRLEDAEMDGFDGERDDFLTQTFCVWIDIFQGGEIGGWIDKFMEGELGNGWVDRFVYGWINRWIVKWFWMDGVMGGWMEGEMGGWIDLWMDAEMGKKMVD